MKKTLFVALVAALVLSFAGSAFAAYSNGSADSVPAIGYVGKPVNVNVYIGKATADAASTATIDLTAAGATGTLSATTVAGSTTAPAHFALTYDTPGTYTVDFAVSGVAGVTIPSETVVIKAAPANVNYDAQTVGQTGTWSYKDLADGAAKYEGGYNAFTNTEFVGDYDNPHGGYDTATNKCKVCHAVHRAEGAYYLLRADSQDDACDYCHVGGSAHSSKVVYDLNASGKGTTNGHTIGASTYIPDSTIAQWTEAVELSTVNANGVEINEDIEVRAYNDAKNDMYRFARHHGHSSASGASRRNYVPVGPLALRCMSCHQVHNASAQTWQPIAFNEVEQTIGTTGGAYEGSDHASYKLLKQFPSGTFVGGTDTYGQVPVGNISIVPETTLTAGVNFDNVRASFDPATNTTAVGALSLARDFNKDGDVADTGETIAMNRPMWVAQSFNGEHDPAEYLSEEAGAFAVSAPAMSVWCADCHNLNVGGWEHLAKAELGFKAHTERTHPAPYTGSHAGPGQCYSCHRNDLSRINSGNSCSQCHYGTGDYVDNRTVGNDAYIASDFPHSGENGDYKMLGSYSIVWSASAQGFTQIDENVTVGPDNIDAVCIRCHGGIGTFH